MQKEVSMK